MGWQGVGEGLVSQFSGLSDTAGATRLAACLLEAAVLGALLGWQRTAAGKAAVAKALGVSLDELAGQRAGPVKFPKRRGRPPKGE
jgi:hypothetical protein